MPTLGDVLGNLMAEVTRARAQADLETVRIAESYAAHPLLKNFTVPRFRLPEITLDVPMIVNKIDMTGAAPPDFEAVRSSFVEVLNAHLAGTRIPPKELRVITKRIDEEVSKVEPQQRNVDLLGLADRLVEAVMPIVTPLFPADTDIATRLRSAVRIRFLNLRPPGTTIDVGVGTQELQQIAAGLITRFKLSVKENGVEWTTIETDGGTESRLVAE